MTDLSLAKTRLRNAVWEARVTGAPTTGRKPEIRVTHLDQTVDGVTLTEGAESGVWDLRVPVPDYAVTDGVQTFLIIDGNSGDKLGDFTLIAGETIADDLRAEIELLRAELDMLKRAFRRHCLETA